MTMKINNKRDIILDFIRQFRDFNTENCFSNGMCWYFTTILRARFGFECAVVYDEVINHFATEIDDRVYDITGDVTDNPNCKWIYWSTLVHRDPKLAARIRRDCIWKLPYDVKTCRMCEHSFWDDYGNIICDKDNFPKDEDDVCDKEILNA